MAYLDHRHEDHITLAARVKSLSEADRMKERIVCFDASAKDLENLVQSLPMHLKRSLLSVSGAAFAELAITFMECAEELMAQEKIRLAHSRHERQAINQDLQEKLSRLSNRRKMLT
jgi:hypothetical protein